MKKHAIVALVALAMSAGVAFATPRHENTGGQMGGDHAGGQMQGRMGGMNVDQMVARMKKNLNLTDKQTDQVKALFEKQQQDMQSWRTDHPNATREDMQAQRREQMTSIRDEMKKILTPEQYKKQQQIEQQQMRQRGMGQMGHESQQPQP